MDGSRTGAAEQAAVWNGVAGRNWVEAQGLMDQAFKPIEEALVAELDGDSGGVLDVGCGAGAVTLAAARLLGPPSRAVGIDISEPMIAAAAARAERETAPARFIQADAQSHDFETARFDAVLSRFGVMFFDDPVAAFANLRRASRPGAALRVVAWRGPDENPFMTVASKAAAPFIPDLPAHAPGQFAFADRDLVETLLSDAGWTGTEIQAADFDCAFPASELEFYFTRLGPLGRVLHEVEDSVRARVIQTVRAAFDPYVKGDQVRFTAACWVVRARA